MSKKVLKAAFTETGEIGVVKTMNVSKYDFENDRWNDNAGKKEVIVPATGDSFYPAATQLLQQHIS